MSPRLRVLFSIGVIGLVLAAGSPARGQTPGRDRVANALDVTDERIRIAQATLEGSDDTRARLEVEAATGIQGRARSSFAGDQLAMSMKLTLEARGHADRAIAIVRGLPDPDRVRAQIERGREMIDRARERVEECDRPRARALMGSAVTMQSRSEDHVAAGRYLAALQLSMSARERALRALRLCDLEENLGEAAERALQRTDQVIARAQDLVTDHPTPLARGALDRAQRLQEQARTEHRAERFEAALRLTQSARTFAHRAVRLASTGG